MIRFGSHALSKPLLGATADMSHPLAGGLDYAFLFNEGQGPPSDIVGRLTSTMLTGTIWTASKTAPALNFANAQAVQTVQSYAVNSTLTIAARIQTPFTGSILTITGLDNGSNRCFQLRTGTANVIQFLLFNSSATAFTTTGAKVVTDGLEHTIVATWDGATARIYIDGVLDVATPQAMVENAGVRLPLIFGANKSPSFTNFFFGNIIWQAAWSRALSASDVAWLSEENYAYIAPPTVRRFFSVPGGGIVAAGQSGLSIGAGRLSIGLG